MRQTLLLLIGFVTAIYANAQPQSAPKSNTLQGYLNNRKPLRPNPYIELPLGAIKAQGWLKEMLLRQKRARRVAWMNCIRW